MLLELPPKYSVAEAVQKIKSITSQHLRKRFKFIDRMYEDKGIWSVGYFASSVGLNESQIKKYIERQNQQDLGIDLTSEFS